MADKPLQAQQDTIRLPIYDIERSRVDPSANQFEQSYLNCWPDIEVNKMSGEKDRVLIKREGIQYTNLDMFATTGAANRHGMVVCDHIVVTQLFDVFVCALMEVGTGNTYIVQYRPAAGTTTLIGTITGTNVNDFVYLTEFQQSVGGVITPAIAVSWQKGDSSSSAGYYAVSDGIKFTATTLTLISSTNFPPNQTPSLTLTGPFQQMNGKIYIMTTNGQIWNSGWNSATSTFVPNDISIWSTLTQVSTYQSPDLGVGVFRYKHHILGLSRNSIEFFNDNGSGDGAVTSLERTEQAFIKFGAVTAKTVCEVDDTLYWVGYSSSNTTGIWKLDGYAPVKITSPVLDGAIQNGFLITGDAYGQSQFRLFPIAFQNRKHLALTPVYNFQLWAGSAGTTNGTLAQSGDTYEGSAYSADTITGATLLYALDAEVFWFSGLAIEDTTISLMYPARYFSSLPNLGTYNWAQYILFSTYPVVSTALVKTCYVFKTAINSAQYYLDDNPAGSAAPFPVSVTFNAYGFGNMKNKRVSKVTMHFAEEPQIPSGTASVSLYVVKNNSVSTPIIRFTQFTSTNYNSKRYYYNNFGTARDWNFCAYSLSNGPFSLRHLELDIAQYVH